ncbi:SdrD B-like domain-containing protein [Rubripirellula tenax]|uniref:SdrD B-like domain-containing protein n=1 Tax=Rubripirellula tenax TaxID=2528015 RepID=UPI0011B4A1B7|nr:SdrD B-like domain-containing protein [Rubripirellula tenax]
MEDRRVLASITGSVFADVNANELRDGGEVGQSGVIAFVDANANQIRDAGELFATTDANGDFVIATVADGEHSIGIEVTGNLRQTTPLGLGGGDGTVLSFDTLTEGHPPSVSQMTDIAVSPDGSTAVGVFTYGERIALYDRDAQDGSLTFTGTVTAPQMYWANEGALSPDGKHFYVAAIIDDSISVFSKDTNGSMALVETVSTTTLGDTDLDGVARVLVSADGSQLYAIAGNGKSLTVFSIDSVTGGLTRTQSFRNGINGVTSLVVPSSIGQTPDGTKVIVGAANGFGSSFFSRDPATGVLTLDQPDQSLGQIRDIVMTADGHFAYLANSTGSIVVLERDAVSGDFAVAETFSTSGRTPWRVGLSADQSKVYFTSNTGDSLSVLSRDAVTGALSDLQTITDKVDVVEMDGPANFAVSPDGDHVYVASENSDSLQTFWVNQGERTTASRAVTIAGGVDATVSDFGVNSDTPRLISITTTEPSLTMSSSVDFVATFSEDVTGVDASDFILHNATLAGASINSVTPIGGSADQYLLTVATPTGTGTVQVRAIDDDTILDADLASTGGAGTGAVIGQSPAIAVDSEAPEVLSIAHAPIVSADVTSIDYHIAFNESVIGVDASDFSITSAGATVGTIDSVSGDGNSYVVRVLLSGGAGNVTLNLVNDDSITDAVGNILSSPATTVGETFANVAPIVRGALWADTDADGLRDPSEPGRVGVVVFADVNSNGTLDSGEPSATTDAEGNYEITGLVSNTTYSIVAQADPDWLQTNPVVYPGQDQLLSFGSAVVAGTSPNDFLNGTTFVTASADGNHVYAIANSSRVAVLSRNWTTGELVHTQTIGNGVNGFSGMAFPVDLVFSPNGRFGFLADRSSDEIVVMSRDLSTGHLSFVARYENGVGGVDGLDTIEALAISPDGESLYSVSTGQDALAVFRVDTTTGLLTPTQLFTNGTAPTTAFNNPYMVIASPDGRQVAVLAFNSSAINIFDVQPGTSDLLFRSTITSVPAARTAEFSRDGRFVYVGSSWSNEMRVFDRDVLSGDWTLVQTFATGTGNLDDLTISPDGLSVAVASVTQDRVKVFGRDASTGMLSELQTIENVAPHATLDGAAEVVYTADGRDLLVASGTSDSITVFSRYTGTPTPAGRVVTTEFKRSTDVDFGFQFAPLAVVSLTTDESSPSNASTLDFNLTFTAPAQGVDVTDFVLASGTGTGASISSVVGGPTEFTITVATGTGDGPIQLQMIDDDTIRNTANAPIGGVGDNGSVLSNIVDMDLTAPTIAFVDRLGPTNYRTDGDEVQFLVGYSEPVTGITASDFYLYEPSLSISDIAANAASNEFTVTVSVAGFEGNVYMAALTGQGLADAAGNLVGGSTITSQQFTVDRTPPTVLDVTLESPPFGNLEFSEFLVTFSENINSFSAADIELVATGPGTKEISSIHYVSGTQRRIVVRNTSGLGTSTINIVPNQTVTDMSGFHLLVGATDNPMFTKDAYVPHVTSIARADASPNNAATVHYTVTFDEPVLNVDVSDLVLVSSLGDVSIDSITGADDVYTVAINTGAGQGNVRLDVATGNDITDRAGNPLSATGLTGETYLVDHIAPTWTSSTLLDWTINSLDEVRFRINFSESVSSVDASDFLLNTTIPDATIVSVVGGGSVYTITANTGTSSGQLGLALAASTTIDDLAGNSLSQIKSIPGYTIDRTTPAVVSIEPMDTLTTGESWFRYEIKFDERIKFLDVADFEVVTTGSAAATVESVLGVNDRFEVTLRRTSNDGTIALKVSDTATIEDYYENDLVGGFVSAIAYTIPGDVTYSGIIWDDTNGDGIFDGGESATPGITVFHDANRDGVLGATEVSTVTIADGSYTIVSHWQANAVITEILSASTQQTFPSVASPSIARLTGDDTPGSEHYLSAYPSISGDGSVVAFESMSSNLVAGDTSVRDIFVHDGATDTITKVSVGHDGSLADGDSYIPVISDNGQFVVFRSSATNLVPNDTNGYDDIFVYDRVAGTTERVNVATDGTQANFDGYRDYDISADGRFVVFDSRAVTIDPLDTTSDADIYVRDRLLETTTFVSTGTYQTTSTQSVSGSGTSPSISDDGNIVAFESYIPAIYGGSVGSDIWIVNRSAGTIKQAHNRYLTGEPPGDSHDPRVSGDGSSIVFFSEARVSGVAHPDDMIFVYDVATEELEMIARSTDGDFVDVELRRPSISHDGRYVAYISKADDVTYNDMIPHVEGFVYDRDTGLTQPVTRRDDGSEGSEQVDWLSLSTDATTVAFGTQSALVDGDTNEQGDIYRRSVGPFQPARSHVVTPVGTTATNLDFGNAVLQSGIIAGELFQDNNRDGIRQAGELPIVGRTVYVDINDNSVADAGEPSIASDADGLYSFSDIATGTYTVRQVMPSDWSPSTGDGDGSTTASIGLPQSVSVGFEDLAHASTSAVAIPTYTSNGFTFGGNDPYFPSKWRVAGNPVAPESTSIYPGTTRTSYVSRRDGAPFDLLSIDTKSQNGSSIVGELRGKRAGLPDVVQTINVSASMQTFAISGFTDVESVTWSQYIAVDNFEFSVSPYTASAIPLGSQVTAAQLEGTVWVDDNLDSVVDPAEPRLAGWTVFQDLNGNGVQDAGEASAVSGADGSYAFAAIEPGPSTIVVETVAGYDPGVPGWSTTINPLPGQTLAQTFSFVPQPASISGFAWLDSDEDGVEDAGEDRVAGVTVYLDSNGNAAFDAGEPTVITDSTDLGFYEFTALAAGSYSVRTADSEFTQVWPLGAHVVDVDPGDAASRRFGVVDLLPTVFENRLIGIPDANAAQLSYSVAFSKPVTGVDASDFSVVTTGTLAATISNISGSDANYVVTVSTTSGVGTVLLRVNDNDSIIDATGDTLAGAGNSGGVDSVITTLDLDAPVVTSLSTIGPLFTSQSSVSFDLQFSEAVLSVDTTDFQITSTGVVGATVSSVDPVAGSTGRYTVVVQTTSGDGTVTIELVDDDSITDTAGNLLAGLGVGNGDFPADGTYTIEVDAKRDIVGRVFDDSIQNGVIDAGEVGHAGRTVYLDSNANGVFDSGEPSTTTLSDDSETPEDESGTYRFTDLPLGTYTVRADVVSPWVATSPTSVNVTLDFETIVGTANFGQRFNTTAISGLIFDDANGNGAQDSGELGDSGVTVYLDANQNGSFDAGERWTIAANDGTYQFDAVDPGEHVVRIIVSSNQVVTTPQSQVDRLFAANLLGNVIELDPADGSLLNSFSLTYSTQGAGSVPFYSSGLALMGDSLFALSANGWIFEADADSGQEIRQFQISTGTTEFAGLARIDGLLYAMDSFSDSIFVVDPTSSSVTQVFDIQALNVGTNFHPGTPQLDSGLGETADGTLLVAVTDSAKRIVIDPATGFIVGNQTHTQPDPDAGFAGGAGFTYVGVPSSPHEVVVYDSAGMEVGSYVASVAPHSLAIGVASSSSFTVTVAFGDQAEGNDFGVVDNFGTVTGTQFIDANMNGVFDGGESPLVGAIVYVDRNDNAWPDADEPQAISAVDGTYTIAEVPVGNHRVRALARPSFRPVTISPGEDRLYASGLGENVGNNLYRMRLFQIDPQDGSVLETIETDITTRFGVEIAFDGDRFIAIDNWNNQLYEITLDGKLIDSRPLGEQLPTGGFSTVVDLGPTIIGDSIISVRFLGTTPYLAQYNPDTNTFEDRSPISIVIDSATPNVSLPNWWRVSAGRTADGNSIVISGNQSLVTLTIDVQTAVGVLGEGPLPSVRARDSLNGEVFVSNNSNIQVYGNPDRIFNVPFVPTGLASGTFQDNGVSVSVAANQSTDAVNHGFRSTLSTVSGSISGDVPAGGAEVYVDTNGNRTFDAGEPTAITDSSGEYSIADVTPGDFSVRVKPIAGKIINAIADDSVRLFVQGADAGNPFIAEIDPVTGETLNSFATQYGTAWAGMALDNGVLYLAQSNVMRAIDADTGALLREIAIPAGYYKGMAILDSVAYLHDSQNGLLRSFDLRTNRLGSTFNLNELNLDYTNSTEGGLGEAPDGQHLILSVGSNAWTVDPATGLFVENLGNLTTGNAIAGAGGQWFEPGNFSSNSFAKSINVRDASGNVTRTITFNASGYIDGMAAESVTATSNSVVLYGADSATGADFVILDKLGSISGIQFVDGNENGLFDTGELPIEGVIVFVDTNFNEWPDANEPQTTSGADGTYTIAGVPAGNAYVRTVTPTNHRPTDVSYSSDRLFTTGRISNPNSPPSFVMDIREIDPINGDVLSVIQTDVEISFLHSTAFDGKQLIVIDNDLDVLHEIALDGTVLDSTPLPWDGNEFLFVTGPVIARGSIYVLGSIGSQHSIYRYDPATNEFVDRKSVTLAFTATETAPQFSAALSESTDGQSIVAFSSQDGVFTIDPTTGRTTSVGQLSETYGWEYAATAVGDEQFVGSNGSSGTLVYDSDWVFQRAFPANYSRQGFGGGKYEDSGLVVDVSSGQVSSGVSFGFQSTLATISGTIRDDVNGDGVSDVGDEPRVGAQVFLDANRNGVLDAGEQSVMTDASGTYTFTDVTPGDHYIRVATGSDERSIATAGNATRLFTTQQSFGSGPTIIRELDPLSGQVLNTFDAPDDGGGVGLALDQYALYFVAYDRFYSLDPDTGELLAYLELPSGYYTGLATVAGHVFAVEPSTNKVLKIDPLSQTVVETFTSSFDLTGTLGESIDGTQLIASTSNNGVIAIDSDFGSEDPNINFLWTNAGFGTAAGEHYHGSQGNVQIRNGQNQLVRILPADYDTGNASGLAVAEVPHGEARLNDGVDDVQSNVDFLIQSGFETNDIELSETSINENVDTSSADVLFAELSAVDASPIAQRFFALVAGDGDDDNSKFVVVGNELRLKQGEVIDYETQSTYQVRVMVGNHTGTLLEKQLTLSVNNLVEINKSNVTINGGENQRSRVDTMTIEFDTDVILQAGAITVTKRGTGGGLAGVVISPLPGATARIFTLTFSGNFTEFGSLADGNYQLTVDASKIVSVDGTGLDANGDGITGDNFEFGDVASDKFFRYYGDVDGDRDVDGSDFLYFRGAYGKSLGQVGYSQSFNFNLDSIVNGSDFLQFRGRYGKTLLF